MPSPERRSRLPALGTLALAAVLAVTAAGPALAVEPSLGLTSPSPEAEVDPATSPAIGASPSPAASPTPSPTPTASPTPLPTPTASPTPTPTPTATPRPTPTPTPKPTPTPTPTPKPTPTPTPTPTPPPPPPPPSAPSSLYLYWSSGFRYQDPNYVACTSTSAMDMLNFVALSGRGGAGFRWRVSLAGATRDSMLSWARSNDTLAGGQGSDPHGWRNMLNAYGWGTNALYAGKRVYEDYGHPTFDAAVKHAVRAMAHHRKPVGLLAWAGKHAQMAVGYYGLKGNPFAKDSAGRYTNNFTVAGLYLADPLRSQGIVNQRISWSTLKYSTNLRIRFRAYLEYDSPYDDPYTAGVKASRTEWYGKWVIIAPVR